MKFEFSDQMTMALLKHLMKGPFDEVAPFVGDFQRQIQQQQSPQQEASPVPPAKQNGKAENTAEP